MTAENMERYQRDGGGPYSSNGAEGGAFVRTRDGLDAPDVQCIFAPLALLPELIGPLPGPGYTLSAYILKPTSRGSVTLRTPLPHSKPRILHNYFATEDDRRSMIGGLRFALAVNRQPALQSVRAAPFLVPESDSEADLLDFVQRRAHHMYHPDEHVRDRPGCRSRAARLRLRRAARRRRVCHADRAARQHERAGHHGRGEGGRPDPRVAAPAASRSIRRRARLSPRSHHPR